MNPSSQSTASWGLKFEAILPITTATKCQPTQRVQPQKLPEENKHSDLTSGGCRGIEDTVAVKCEEKNITVEHDKSPPLSGGKIKDNSSRKKNSTVEKGEAESQGHQPVLFINNNSLLSWVDAVLFNATSRYYRALSCAIYRALLCATTSLFTSGPADLLPLPWLGVERETPFSSTTTPRHLSIPEYVVFYILPEERKRKFLREIIGRL